MTIAISLNKVETSWTLISALMYLNVREFPQQEINRAITEWEGGEAIKITFSACVRENLSKFIVRKTHPFLQPDISFSHSLFMWYFLIFLLPLNYLKQVLGLFYRVTIWCTFPTSSIIIYILAHHFFFFFRVYFVSTCDLNK